MVTICIVEDMRQSPLVYELASVKKHLEVKTVKLLFLKFVNYESEGLEHFDDIEFRVLEHDDGDEFEDLEHEHDNEIGDIQYEAHIRFFQFLFPNAEFHIDKIFQ